MVHCLCVHILPIAIPLKMASAVPFQCEIEKLKCFTVPFSSTLFLFMFFCPLDLQNGAAASHSLRSSSEMGGKCEAI